MSLNQDPQTKRVTVQKGIMNHRIMARGASQSLIQCLKYRGW